MNTTKLSEAIAELQQQRNALDTAINTLKNALAMLNGQGNVAVSAQAIETKRSYIDDTVTILGQVGHPLHVKDLTARIAKMRLTPVTRGSIESSILRHIGELKHRSRLKKTGPSTYGLSMWPRALSLNPDDFTDDEETPFGKHKASRLRTYRGKEPLPVAIPKFLDSQPGRAFQHEQIAEALGANAPSVRSACARLVTAGKIAKVRPGKGYRSIVSVEMPKAV